MKIKAKLEKFNRLEANAIPIEKSIRKALAKGKIVDCKDATELIAMNIVEEVFKKGNK